MLSQAYPVRKEEPVFPLPYCSQIKPSGDSQPTKMSDDCMDIRGSLFAVPI